MTKSKPVAAVLISILILAFPVMGFWATTAVLGLTLHFLVPLVGIVFAVLIGFIAFGVSNKVFYKKSIIFLSLFSLLLCGAIGTELYYRFTYLPSITVGQGSAFYKDYLPFSNSEKLAHLDSEPDLHFSAEDALPVVDGATALFPVYCSFVEAVYPSDCEIEKYVNFRTTSRAYEALINGDDDIIFVAEPSSEQMELAKNSGVVFNFYPIGFEAFVFIVNKKNPVESLSVQQIKDIYTGKIVNWKDAGGKNQMIRPFQRDANSGSQTAFLALMGKDADLIPPETHQVNGMGGLIDVVSDYQNHGNALGYSFRYYVESMKNNAGIKVLKLNGIEATRENIRNKTYPVSGNFYAITIKERESENAKKLINWILSPQGQELIEKVGYVPVS